MEGGGGIVAIPLTVAVDSDDTTLTVASTTDYLGADYITIGSEEILYAAKNATQFTGCTRGYNGTTAAPHAIGDMLYTKEASSINNALGFNIAATTDTMGWWATISVPVLFFIKTVPHIIMMNYSFLSGSLAIIGWFFFAAGAGFVITLALYMAGGRRVS